MKWPRKKQTANQGVLHVEGVVNDHGSVFRPVHQETDVGIDGHIELVDAETATGRLIGVQIKSGDSYVANHGEEFSVHVDQDHLEYWCSYSIPVILVCYSQSHNIAAWTPIREYVRREEYHRRTPVTSIRVPFSKEFNVESLDGPIASLARANSDRQIHIECVDKCLAGDARQKIQGLSILADHPESRNSRATAFLARRLLFDDDNSVSDLAIRTLAFHAARVRWSFNPNSVDEREVMKYASNLCGDFTIDECRHLIERIDDAWFGGPDAMGERVFDLLVSCDDSQRVLEDVATDKNLPMQRRINALYMLHGCDDAELLDYDELANDPYVGDVYRNMYADELESTVDKGEKAE